MPPDDPDVHQIAHASGSAAVFQAGGDQHFETHLHFGAGTRRAETGAVTEVCPYPTGMSAFRPDQAEWFFGRDELVASVLDRLDQRLRTGGSPLVLVAPSGAGKSSLLQAGLVPRLEQGSLPGSARWPGLLFTPGAKPVEALAAAIASVNDEHVIDVHRRMSDPEQFAEDLRAGLRGLSAADGGQAGRVVVIVDQLEELFTMCTEGWQRRAFLDVLAKLSAQGPAGREPAALVVYGLRADFYAQCAGLPELREALEDGQIVVGPMSAAELRAAIVNPAQRAGLRIEDGLVDVLLRDLGVDDFDAAYEAGRLPLLAHAMRGTWRERHGRTLTVQAYRNTGGIQGAVAKTAERTFTGLKLSPEQQRTAKGLFLRLVSIGDAADDARRRVSQAALVRDSPDRPTARAVLEAFTRDRLLTQGQHTVEITHEALLRAWPRLREWMSQERSDDLTRQDLEEAAAAWSRHERDTARLFRGRRLDNARAWSAEHRGELGAVAMEFLAASRAAARGRRGIAVVLAVLVLVLPSVAAVYAFGQRDAALFQQIAAQAGQLHGTDVSMAAQLHLVAHDMRPDDLGVRTDLINTANTPLATPMRQFGDVHSVAWSPDGTVLASASWEGTVQLWDASDRSAPVELGPPLEHRGNALSVVFSADGALLASGSGDGEVQLWDVTDPAGPKRIGAPLAHSGSVYSLALSGSLLASGASDGTVRLWDISDREAPKPLGVPMTGHREVVYSLALSEDGSLLVSGSFDRTVRLWDVSDRSAPRLVADPLTGAGRVTDAVLSPDGGLLAAVSDDATTRLWDVSDRSRPRPVGELLEPDHPAGLLSVALSPDGSTLATGASDGTVRLWNIADPAHPSLLHDPLTGHTGSVYSLAFTPDGSALASSSRSEARLWNLPGALLVGDAQAANSMVMSSDGRTLASANEGRAVRLWDVSDAADPRALGVLGGDRARVLSIALSQDNTMLVTGSLDGVVQLWNIADRAHPRLLGSAQTGHVGTDLSLALNRDATLLATGSSDRTIRLWDVSDRADPVPLGEPLTGHSDGVLSVALNPDGTVLASGSLDETARVWDVSDPADPKPLGDPVVSMGSVRSVHFSADGRVLVRAGAGEYLRVGLFDMSDPADPRVVPQDPVEGHTNAINSTALSEDGRTLASASRDGTVRVWDVSDLVHPKPLVGPLTGHNDGVLAVALNHDGSLLASASDDGTVRLWRLDAEVAEQRICATTRNVLTEDRWEERSIPFGYAPPCGES
ncbi:hypothetical protein LZ318_11285 [Saccharopolyspora indica]|uniref:nSTAND1 domain-containing NTPase n=1 Tax=Saccharopolyspora indica TaxID=1229659 RepID=UPI0022EB99D3|nr:AAA family ATPase [Saccharopolyspora indica]MDA3645243.1 hypothetical protein [Saccharopolyspora indica]